MEEKTEVKIALGITLAVCFFSGVGYWILVNRQNWPITGVLVVLGIFAWNFLLSAKNLKENRSVVWAMCFVFCFLMILFVVLFGQGSTI